VTDIDPTYTLDLASYSASANPGESRRVAIADGTGQPDYTWSVSGNLEIWRYGTIDDRIADVRLLAGSCEGGTVYLTDGCGASVTFDFISNVSPAEFTSYSATANPGESRRVTVADGTGQPDYTWSVSGNLDIWRYGTIDDRIADVRNLGGGGTVNLTDGCGANLTFTITDA